MLVHIANRDPMLALQGAEVLCHILIELARYECQSQRQPSLKAVYLTILEVIRICKHESALCALSDGFLRTVQNH